MGVPTMESAALTALLSAVQLSAQESPPSQLDFLAGDWDLYDPSGARIGHSRILVQAPGAMLFEERLVGEDHPQPLWFENSEADGGWIQLFVGIRGLVREFRTTSPPGEWPLVMGADVTLRDGTPVRFRMTMSRRSNDETRRILEVTRDGGTQWDTVFDYGYRRAVAAGR